MRRLAILATLALVACPSTDDNPARKAVDAQRSEAPAQSSPPATEATPTNGTTPAETWTCPMHPDVVQDRPGKCPKCGMDLVKRGA